MEDDDQVDVEVVVVFDDGIYRVEMWESFPFFVWQILRDDECVQEGGSISENAGRTDSQKLLDVIMRQNAKANVTEEGS
jgi:soluble methane monooxygenase-binding protein MmoD